MEKDLKGSWEAFLDIWCTQYTGYPQILRTDAGKAFESGSCKALCKENGIELIISEIEAHNSIGVGERYHSPLRRIYIKIEYDFPAVLPQTILKIAVRAMNDTMGVNGLVLFLLVFEAIPVSRSFAQNSLIQQKE